jgi:hypothetical protein
MISFSILMTTVDGNEHFQISDSTCTVYDFEGELNKQQLELVQLKHYQEKVKKIRPEFNFEIESQADRPDFKVCQNNKIHGVDVTEFAFTKRRSAFAQFREVKELLRKAYREGELRSCRGLQINLSFPARDKLRTNQLGNAVKQLVSALNTYYFDGNVPDDWVNTPGPGPFPLGESGISDDALVSWYVVGNLPAGNSFYKECNFNVEHQYAENVDKNDVRAQLEKIINKHDKPDQNIDELVIVASGPDKYGEAIIDESAICNVFINRWKGSISEPKNIKRIVIDSWNSNDIYVLYDRLNK